MVAFITFLTTAVFVVLGEMVCLTHANLALKIDSSRVVSSTHPTEQNNIITLACSRGNSNVPGSFVRIGTARYFVRNPLNSEERELEFSVQSGLLTFMIAPELEGAYHCRDSNLSSEIRSPELKLTGESKKGGGRSEPLPSPSTMPSYLVFACQSGRLVCRISAWNGVDLAPCMSRLVTM